MWSRRRENGPAASFGEGHHYSQLLVRSDAWPDIAVRLAARSRTPGADRDTRSRTTGLQGESVWPSPPLTRLGDIDQLGIASGRDDVEDLHAGAVSYELLAVGQAGAPVHLLGDLAALGAVGVARPMT